MEGYITLHRRLWEDLWTFLIILQSWRSFAIYGTKFCLRRVLCSNICWGSEAL